MSGYDIPEFLPNMGEPDFGSFVDFSGSIHDGNASVEGSDGSSIAKVTGPASHLSTPELTDAASAHSTSPPAHQFTNPGLFTQSSAMNANETIFNEGTAAQQPDLPLFDPRQLTDERLVKFGPRFWDYEQQITSEYTGKTYSGTYAELYQHAEVRGSVVQRFVHWQNQMLQQMEKVTAAQGTGSHVPRQFDFNGYLPTKAERMLPTLAFGAQRGAPSILPAPAANFDLEHGSVTAARAYIARPPADACIPIKAPISDNWRAMRNQKKFEEICAELFNALTHPRLAVRYQHFNDKEWAYYSKNHEKAETAVLRELRTADQVTMVKARVVLMVDEIISVHEHGVPKYLMDRAQARTHRGYQPEDGMTCKTRVNEVINYAKHNKYVASDIIQGKNIGDLARSPHKYVARKLDNAQTNQARSKDLNTIKEVKNGKKATAELVQEGPRKRGRPPAKQTKRGAGGRG